MSERFGESWWGRRWIEALERLSTAWQNRLPRGKDYASKGHVISVAVSPGKIVARVQGSRSKPYNTTIELPVFREAEWDRIIRLLASEARFPAQLLAGEMPVDIDAVFQRGGFNLFPVRNSEMIGSCTCPDKARPCKHIAAVHYSFGEALDRDPFLLFQVRGADRVRLLEGFHRAWFGDETHSVVTQDAASPAGDARGVAVAPLSADRFNRSPVPIGEMSFRIRASEQPLLVLQRLGAPKSWEIPITAVDLLGTVYEAASRTAIELALDPDGFRDDPDASWSDPDDADSESLNGSVDASLDGSESDDDLDDFGEHDEDEDGDGSEDGDEDGEEESDASEWDRPISGFHELPSGKFRTLPAPLPAAPPASPLAPVAAAPPPGLFLPGQIGIASRLRAEAPISAPAASVAAREQTPVLIRKGVAAISRNRSARGRASEENGTSPDAVATAQPPSPPRVGATGAAVTRGEVPPIVAEGAIPGPMIVRRRGGADRNAMSTPEGGLPAVLPGGPQRNRDVDHAAFASARAAWRAKQSLDRLHMLLATADRIDSGAASLSEEADRLLARSQDEGDTLGAPALLLLSAVGRVLLAADVIESMGSDAWSGPDDPAWTWIPVGLLAGMGRVLSMEGTQLEACWRYAFEPATPASKSRPVGATLLWLMDRAVRARTISEADRQRVLGVARELVLLRAGSEEADRDEESATRSARMIVATAEALLVSRGGTAVRAFLSDCGELIVGTRRLKRIVISLTRQSALLRVRSDVVW